MPHKEKPLFTFAEKIEDPDELRRLLDMAIRGNESAKDDNKELREKVFKAVLANKSESCELTPDDIRQLLQSMDEIKLDNSGILEMMEQAGMLEITKK